jgi:hypothetical protein
MFTNKNNRPPLLLRLLLQGLRQDWPDTSLRISPSLCGSFAAFGLLCLLAAKGLRGRHGTTSTVNANE